MKDSTFRFFIKGTEKLHRWLTSVQVKSDQGGKMNVCLARVSSATTALMKL